MLRIETFTNSRGGNAFFKALTHPLAARAMPDLLHRLGRSRVALYDVDGQADSVAELYPLGALALAGCFVQDVTAIGASVLGQRAQPVTALKGCDAGTVLVASFEAERAIAHIRHLL